MNNSPDKIRAIDRKKLDESDYFQSLLEAARTKGLLSEGDIERLQFECLDLLAYKTERYNAGDSSSIPVEKARDIMNSILFTIGLSLKTYQNPDDAVTALQNEPLNEFYKKGRRRINTMLATSKIIHGKLLSRLAETKNVFYSATLKGGISGFFKLYRPDYAAHEIHITADYPLFNPVPKLLGVEFIRWYLEAACYENQFCGYFSANDFHRLLLGFAEDYDQLLINIYELVLTASIGCAIVGTDVKRLNITEAGVRLLCEIFTDKSKSEITVVIFKAAEELQRCFGFSEGLARYMRTGIPIIADKIEFAARNHTLNRLFFTPVYHENHPEIIFSYGEAMVDEWYRKIIDEIRDCRFSRDKIAIIKKNIRSLTDLEGVLLDADLTENEIQDVLQGLSLPEIAAVSKKYQLQQDIEVLNLRDVEIVLRECLRRFISQLPPEKQKFIDQACRAMKESF